VRGTVQDVGDTFLEAQSCFTEGASTHQQEKDLDRREHKYRDARVILESQAREKRNNEADVSGKDV